ncbi:MAG TPA: AMP-binding protein [Acidimicrobiales bacterium]|nr:AMP-binding protein [Acidimicrobiales bacterium]
MSRTEGPGLHWVGRWLLDRARANPEGTAIECAGRRLNYSQLLERVIVMAADLRRRGARPGDRVATITHNDVDQICLLFACCWTGATLVPLNWRLAPPELAAQLDVVMPALVASGDSHWQQAADALTASACAPEHVSLASLGRPPALAGVTPAVVADDDPLLIIFTSGTTGRPKGAVLTHANCFWTNLSFDGAVPLSSHDVVLQVLPQFHVGGWNVQPLQAFWKGARLLLERDFDPGRALSVISKQRVTTMMGVPTTYLRMAEDPGFSRADLSSLHQVVVGGAAMPPDVLEAWLRRGVAVVQGYGLTEASPNVLCLPTADATTRAGSVGRPYGFVDVELHDPFTEERLDGPATGELWVSGPNVFAGYWHDERSTQATMNGRWLRTGDVAERDEAGYYRISARLKEIYISGGENVYPGEVEAVLRAHPCVADAAVVGVADRRWGEVGVAFVEARPGRALTDEDLVGHCRSRLAGFKLPRRVLVVDALPRLGSGKLDKRALASMAAPWGEVPS